MEAVIYNKDRQPLKRRKSCLLNYDGDTDNFSIGSKVKKLARAGKKQSKADSRTYKKKVKADSLGLRYSAKGQAALISAQGEAQNNNILAQQGIVGNPIQQPADIGQQALNIGGGLLGGGLQDSSIGITQAADYENEGQIDTGSTGGENKPVNGANNKMLIFAVIGIAAFFMMKK